MGWVVGIVVVAMLFSFLHSNVGKLVAGAAVVAIGALLLQWITGFAVFAVLAKLCAIVMVIVIVGAIIMAIIGK